MSQDAQPRRRSPAPWIALAVIVALLVAGGLVALRMVTAALENPLGTTTVDTRSTQIAAAVTREQQVVLLSLAVQGLDVREHNQEFFGVSVPFSDRTTFLQYEFTAKLGLEGGEVTVTNVSEGVYRVSLPEFVFIGYDVPKFWVAAESNGVLSWVTPTIDPLEMINTLLSDASKAAYIEQHRETLQSQAQAFYTNLILSIDPSARVEFSFAPASQLR